MYCKHVTLKEANAFVTEHHRHHAAVVGHKFSIGVFNDGNLCGVAIVGRPVNRVNDNGDTLEVTRLCTDGTRNACSMLYGKCARIAQELGYGRILTYILQSETGASLRASGWQLTAENCGGGSWAKCSRRANNEAEPNYPTEKKKRYEKLLQEGKQ